MSICQTDAHLTHILVKFLVCVRSKHVLHQSKPYKIARGNSNYIKTSILLKVQFRLNPENIA